MTLSNQQFDQPQLTGVDWKKSAEAGREALINERFPMGASPMGSVFSSSDREGSFKDQGDRAVPTRSRPTQEVTRLLRLTDIPDNDLMAAQGTGISAADRSSFFNPLSAGAAGQRNILSGQVYFDTRSPAAEKRAVITHELAHTLQSTLPKSVMDVELHKHRVDDASKYLDISEEEAGDRLNKAGAGAMTHMAGMAMFREAKRTLKRAERLGRGHDRELEAPPMITSGLPIYEGSAEGYRERYQGGRANFTPGYTPEKFEAAMGPNAAEVFVAAKEFTRNTGHVVPDDHILKATRLAGVLASDLDESGKRQSGHDAATVHRMMTHIIHHSQQDPDNPLPSPHEAEFRQRTKAIEGEIVQGSLFPDMFPDVDQFGDAASGTPEASPRGLALREGRPTEMRPENTLDATSRARQAIRAQRQSNKPLPIYDVEYNDPRASKHRSRLQGHQRLREERQREEAASAARAAENQSRVEAGELHPEIEKWLGKLVYQKKADYARAYATARQAGQEAPPLPPGLKPEHAEKARESVEKIFTKFKIGG